METCKESNSNGISMWNQDYDQRNSNRNRPINEITDIELEEPHCSDHQQVCNENDTCYAHFVCSPSKRVKMAYGDEASHDIATEDLHPEVSRTNTTVTFPDEPRDHVFVYDDHSQDSDFSGKDDADDTLSAEEIEKDCERNVEERCDVTLSYESNKANPEEKQNIYFNELDGAATEKLLKNEELYNEGNSNTEDGQYQMMQGSSDVPNQELHSTNSSNFPAYAVLPNSSAQPQHESQWYDGTYNSPMVLQHPGIPPQAAAIQSNFAQTMTQFAPSLMTCNIGEVTPTSQQLAGLAPICSTPAHQVQPFTSMPNIQEVPGQGKLVYTPHPKTGGYMFYVSQPTTGQPVEFSTPQNSGDCSSKAPLTIATPVNKIIQPGKTAGKSTGRKSSTPLLRSKVILNSSGEENQSPPDPTETGTRPQGEGGDFKPGAKNIVNLSFFQQEDSANREQHNQKERRRRARIKDACNLMRQLVPGITDKTDKATVFEFAARYIHFLKSFTGTDHDKDFLMKYSPY